MMAQQFLTLEDGQEKLVEVISVSLSTGPADADKLVSTGADGKVDLSLLPEDIGEDVQVLTATEDLAAGALVNVHSAGLRNADAAAPGKEADGFVLAAAASGDPAKVYFLGSNVALSGLTQGARYYLAAGAPGAITATPPAAHGNVVQYVGRATSATRLAFAPTDGVILA